MTDTHSTDTHSLAERWRQLPIRLSCVAFGAIGALEALRLAHPDVATVPGHRPLLLAGAGLAIAAGVLGAALRHARRS